MPGPTLRTIDGVRLTGRRWLTDDTPAASWEDPGDAATYDVKIDDTAGCASPLQACAQFTSCGTVMRG